MTLTLPRFEIGDSAKCSLVHAFPLYVDESTHVEYRLGDEMLETRALVVDETDESGSVSEVVAKNVSDQRVLLLEGQELVGAKQNRIINTSILVPANCCARIPVCCVEEDRWQSRSIGFSYEGRLASAGLRSVLKKTVGLAVEQGLGHRADQQGIWREIIRRQSQLGIQSQTHAMSETFISCQELLADVGAQLPYVDGAAGIVLTFDGRIVSVDLFDRPSTCLRVWPCLVRAGALDAIGKLPKFPALAKTDIRRYLELINTANWRASPTVGEGQEYRCSIPGRFYATSLTLGSSNVHISLSPH